MRTWLACLRERLLPRDWPALRWVLGAYVVSQLAAIGWDLPCSFSWENDGISPRDIFAGVALNMPGGPGHTYPLLHNLIVMLASLPVLVVAALTAPAFDLATLREHIIAYEFMTPIAVIARLIAVAMSGVAVACIARIVARLHDRRAGIWAAVFAVTNVSVAYYGRVGNLDGPYLMWMMLAADRLLDVAERGERRDYGLFAVFVGASIATKDQAYAPWVLPGLMLVAMALPLAVVRSNVTRWLAAGADHRRELLRAIGVGAFALAALGGALINPPGFVQRLQRLRGTASQDWTSYANDTTGLLLNVRDLGAGLGAAWWPWPALALVLGGVIIAARPGNRGSGGVLQTRVWRLLPLWLSLSYVLFFTLVVRRYGLRFLLPAGLCMAGFAGVGAAKLLDVAEARAAVLARIGRIALVGLVAAAAAQSLTVQLTQWGDARFAVESWLGDLPAASRVETYGVTCSQPRFGRGSLAALHVARVGPKPLARRNPLLGVQEVRAPYGAVAERAPDVLVVPWAFAAQFEPGDRRVGKRMQTVVERRLGDDDAAAHFKALLHDRLPGYKLVLRSLPRLPAWAVALGAKPAEIHGSTGVPMLVFAREGFGAGAAANSPKSPKIRP